MTPEETRREEFISATVREMCEEGFISDEYYDYEKGPLDDRVRSWLRTVWHAARNEPWGEDAVALAEAENMK